MGTFATLDGQSPVDGSVAQPVASGRYGMLDPIRQQVAVVIGQAGRTLLGPLALLARAVHAVFPLVEQARVHLAD